MQINNDDTLNYNIKATEILNYLVDLVYLISLV